MTAMAVVDVGSGKSFHPADADSIVLISVLKIFGDPSASAEVCILEGPSLTRHDLSLADL